MRASSSATPTEERQEVTSNEVRNSQASRLASVSDQNLGKGKPRKQRGAIWYVDVSSTDSSWTVHSTDCSSHIRTKMLQVCWNLD